MGVTENRRHIYFEGDATSGGDDRPHRNRNDSSGSSDGGWEIIPHDGIEDAQPSAPSSARPPRRSRPPPSPKPRKVPRCGHELKLKKGRRSRHRYDNERMLFQEGFGPGALDLATEEYLDGADIVRETRSHFTTLLKDGNSRLLEAFLDQEDDEIVSMKSFGTAERTSFVKDPEDAYLSISCSARTALKKHFPMGMLDGLEVEIRDFFVEHPDDEFVAAELSSYERLLAHAACMYHQLNSRSFDENGKRKLKVNNPRGKDFKPIDPCLSKYLGMRSSSRSG